MKNESEFDIPPFSLMTMCLNGLLTELELIGHPRNLEDDCQRLRNFGSYMMLDPAEEFREQE